MDQQASAGEILALPAWLMKAPVDARTTALLQAPVIVLPAFGELALAQQTGAAKDMGVDMGWFDGDGLAER